MASGFLVIVSVLRQFALFAACFNLLNILDRVSASETSWFDFQLIERKCKGLQVSQSVRSESVRLVS